MSVVCSGALESAPSAAAPQASVRRRAVSAYTAIVSIAAVAALAFHVRLLPLTDSLAWLVLLPLAAVGARRRIELDGAARGLSVSLASAADLLALLWLGPFAAMATALVGIVSQHLRPGRRSGELETILNAGLLVVSVQCGNLALIAFGRAESPNGSIAAACAYFAANVLLAGTAAALLTGRRVASVLGDAISGGALHAFVGLGTGAIAAHLLDPHPGRLALGAVLLPSMYVVYDSYRAHLERLSAADVQLREISALRQALVSRHGPGSRRTPDVSLFDDIMVAHREVHALYDIAQSIATKLDVTETMTLLTSKLGSVVPFSACALFLEEEDGTLACRFASGVDRDLLDALRVAPGDGVAGWVARHKRPLVNARPSADFDAAGLLGLTTLQAVMMYPLVAGGRLVGALALYHVTPGAFTDDHRRLLEGIAEQAAGVVHNSILYEQTRREALTDALTRLPNTRFLATHVSRELARAARLQTEISLLVLDLDGFKEINDRHGHHVGDLALCDVARALVDAIRPYDICVRYAGDEFVVMLSDCGPEEAGQKRRELQRAIGDLRIDTGAVTPESLGCSCGAASFPGDGSTYEALLALADRRMYEDKNRRKRHGAVPETPPAAPPRRSVFAKIPPERSTGRTG